MIFIWYIFWIMVLSVGLTFLSPRLVSCLLSYDEPEEYARQIRLRLHGTTVAPKFELMRDNRKVIGAVLAGAATFFLLPLITTLARFFLR